MPEETIYLTEREVRILRIFLQERILNDLTIADELEFLAGKLRK